MVDVAKVNELADRPTWDAIDFVMEVNSKLLPASLEAGLITKVSEEYIADARLQTATMGSERVQVVKRHSGEEILAGLVYLSDRETVHIRGLEEEYAKSAGAATARKSWCSRDLTMSLRDIEVEVSEDDLDNSAAFEWQTGLVVEFRNRTASDVSLDYLSDGAVAEIVSAIGNCPA